MLQVLPDHQVPAEQSVSAEGEVTCKEMLLLGTGAHQSAYVWCLSCSNSSILYSISRPLEGPSFAKQISWCVGSHQSRKARIKNKLGKVSSTGEAPLSVGPLGFELVLN